MTNNEKNDLNENISKVAEEGAKNEGKQVEDRVEELKEKVNNFSVKKIAKTTGLTLIALALLGGGSAFAYKMYEEAEERKENAARSQLVKSQAQTENITLKTEDEVKEVVAKSIGTDKNSIYFEEVTLTHNNFDRGRGERYRRWQALQQPISTTTAVSTTSVGEANEAGSETPVTTTATTSQSQISFRNYIYIVEAKYNGLNYEFLVDSVTGEILTSRVDS